MNDDLTESSAESSAGPAAPLSSRNALGRLRWLFFIAGRFLATRRKEKGHTASLLSVLGIAVGVLALITVLAVMNGFQHGTIESILEVNSYHLRVHGPRSASPGVAEDLAGLGQVQAATRFLDVQTMVRGYFNDPGFAVVRGIDGDAYSEDEGLRDNLSFVSGSFDIKRPASIVIGLELARSIGATVGDTISLVSLTGDDLDIRNPEERRVNITGVFRTGYLDYDRAWAYMEFDHAVSLLGADPSEAVVGVKLEDRDRIRSAETRIRAHLASMEGEVVGGSADSPDAPDAPDNSVWQVESWRSYNSSIFGALAVEKAMLLVLVGLIFVVVSVNIFQSLKRSVIERADEIAIIKALGADPRGVQMIFVLEGVLIGAVGAFAGLLLGLALATNVNSVFVLAERALALASDLVLWLAGPFVGSQAMLPSPSYGYLVTIPTDIVFVEVAAVCLFAVGSSVVAAYLASGRAARIKPAEVLRDE